MPMRLLSPLPEFHGATEWINGEVNSEQLAGKPVLVHFWAVSCCLYEEGLPLTSKWLEQYGKEYDLQMIGVHTPRSETDTDIAAVKEIVAQYELRHPVIVDNRRTVADAFHNVYIPAIYLFDHEHQLRHIQAGENGLKLFEQRLPKILGIHKETDNR